MTDLLNIELINSLPHPFWVSENGKDWWWPVHDIDVETGLMRIDVCGQLQACHFSDWNYLRDDAHVLHDRDIFYIEDETP
ncbi:hypothetical protein [Pseudomonas sp. WS 5079]|uniref:hypothetical protein n=1 Tax=Pseudomonas sp. WS 5079 TaxID=2717492 RepID=UPI001554B1C5|nr:hypothetical protein [Pseudomonas sp. WS 5079]NMX65522.1 hypothetical protein [Pseudomonas sp. WS 5079]